MVASRMWLGGLGSARAWPWGLIGTLALVCGTDRALARRRVDFVPWTTAIYEYASGAVRREASRHPILCFGDSLMKCGLLPAVVEGRTGCPTFNLAVTGSTPAHTYFMLRRALRSGARPSAVLVNFKGYIFLTDPSIHGTEINGLANVGEALELAAEAGKPDVVAKWALARLSLAVHYRNELRAAVLGSVRTGPGSAWPAVAADLKRFNANEGAQPLDKNPLGALALDSELERLMYRGDGRCLPVNRAFIRKFFQTAADHQIPVYLVVFPATRRVQRRREELGLEGRYDEIVLREAARFANVRVLDGRSAEVDPSAFADAFHFDRDGARLFSGAVAEVLAAAGPSFAARGGRTVLRTASASAPRPAPAPGGPVRR